MTTRAASLVVHPRHVIFAEFSGRVPICLRLLSTLDCRSEFGFDGADVGFELRDVGVGLVYV